MRLGYFLSSEEHEPLDLVDPRNLARKLGEPESAELALPRFIDDARSRRWHLEAGDASLDAAGGPVAQVLVDDKRRADIAALDALILAYYTPALAKPFIGDQVRQAIARSMIGHPSPTLHP